MRTTILTFGLFVMWACGLHAQDSTKVYQKPAGKDIYIPQDLKDNDFTRADSKWSYARMAYTDNVVVFWEKPFGPDPATAPDLEGKNMKVDIPNLLEQVESFYIFFRDTLKFIGPGSNADKYRMMVMLNYSLEGTAYGGDYDGTIGALWISPNRVQDRKLNCIAHELGHSFQSQISCDGKGEAWGGGGIFEMTSQWMLWQVNPEWVTDENYHWEAFKKLTHLAFLHGENIYHSPYVLEYWGEKRGREIIGELFRQGKRGEDPLQTYKRINNLSWNEVADELFDCYRHLVTFDFKRVKNVCAKYANEISSPCGTNAKGWTTATDINLPQQFGFNVLPVKIPTKGKKVTVEFEGDPTVKGTWKVGLVGVKRNGTVVYPDTMTGKKCKTTFKDSDFSQYSHLWFVVMPVPDEYHSMAGFRRNPNYDTFPYKVRFK